MHITKDLVAASATPLVLGILAEGESYGYAILKQVNELSGGQLEWTDGLLYPLLHRLERLGHVESAWETPPGGRRRKYYRITDQGRAELAEQRRQWAAVVDALQGVWSTTQSSGRSRHRPGRRDDDRRQRQRSGGPDRRVAGLHAPPPGAAPHRRRGAGRPSSQPDRRADRGGPASRRGVPHRRQTHGQPRRAVAGVRPRAFRAAVEAARAARGAGRAHRRPFPSRAACHGALRGRRGARDQGAGLVRA